MRPELLRSCVETDVRLFPAMVSTEAEARRWARAGAPHGALVVADHQLSPRGRGGMPWTIPEEGMGFSMIIRHRFLEHEVGLVYATAVMALTDCHADSEIDWPDTVTRGDQRIGSTAVYAETELLEITWSIMSFAIYEAGREPERQVARIAGAIEHRLRQDRRGLLEQYEDRLATTGARVVAHLIPMGPTGRRVAGTAIGADRFGSLRVRTEAERVAVLTPNDVGRLDVVR